MEDADAVFSPTPTSNNLGTVKLPRLGRSGDTNDSPDDDATRVETVETESAPQQSVGKGRPTPKRREAEGRRRGPMAPAPLTAKEARARRKATRGSKEDRKIAAAERRERSADQRARMMAGEEKFLLPRDRGPVRGYVRDLVDARRNFVGLFMPLALILLAGLFLPPDVQSVVTLAVFVIMLLMVLDGYLIGRRINNRVRERFPDTADGGFKLGWYAFVRASQVRKMRAPKPRVGPGDAV